jgi:transposase-like protein
MLFVKRWLEGERVTDICREFGISRKTAYKTWCRSRRAAKASP